MDDNNRKIAILKKLLKLEKASDLSFNIMIELFDKINSIDPSINLKDDVEYANGNDHYIYMQYSKFEICIFDTGVIFLLYNCWFEEPTLNTYNIDDCIKFIKENNLLDSSSTLDKRTDIEHV